VRCAILLSFEKFSYPLQTLIFAKYVRSLNYHVITFDYRGYADSTDKAPDETGVVNDAKVTFNDYKFEFHYRSYLIFTFFETKVVSDAKLTFNDKFHYKSYLNFTLVGVTVVV
jgi:hypothetical protein